MRFGVLGPLEVWGDDGRPVRIPEAKVRALLADLLAAQGRPVSADRLIDDLWGERPPAKPAAALRVKVSQLRKVLEEAEPGGRRLLVFRAAGYELAAETDADRFLELAARARRSDDPRIRAGLFADALALWRGPAYADFRDEEFARPVVARLEEEQLVVLEEQAEARLELGEHAVLAAELADPVAAHPLRERLRAAHIRALYRAGRQSEALAAYADLRDRLRDELGVDPSPELVALHQAILVQDPALAPAGRPRTNLPVPLTELIGRDAAVAEVRALLRANRLVTLTGAGGVGKTRLALETASGLEGDFPDGIWLVELAAVDRASEMGVLHALAAALHLRDDAIGAQRGAAKSCRVMDALSGKHLLLVLDNCEHVVEPVAELVEPLLRWAPKVRVLATSQEPLNLTGEVLWPVPPLDVPETSADVAALRRSSAVRLLLARAPGLVLDEGNAEAVAAICQRLDGIPLALELAASRLRALGPRQLLERLDDRFRLLAAGKRDAPARQQTLRAMIDWSWELLSEPERVVLRRLAVHADSCSLEAAEAVCPGDGVAEGDVLDLLARLVDRSLVVMVSGGRYRLLESVAAYCVERLAEAGELEEVRRRHLTYFTALAERADIALRGHGQREWLSLLDAESPNIRAAIENAATAGDAVRLANAMGWYWTLRGRFEEGRQAIEAALARPGSVAPSPHAEATVWRAGLILQFNGCDRAVQEALPVLDKISDPVRQARMRWYLAYSLWGQGDLGPGETLARQALAGAEAAGDRWGVAAALSSLAAAASTRGDLAEAARDGERSAELFTSLGDRCGLLQASAQLAQQAEIVGDYDRAAVLHQQALTVAEELELWLRVSWSLSGLGRIALLRGDYAQADELHERARRLAVEQSNRFAEHFAEVGLALSARRQGRLDVAERHLRRWLDWLRMIEGAPGAALVLAELGFIAELRGRVEEALALHKEGYEQAISTDDPRAIALAQEGLAGARALAGDHRLAARLLGAAASLRESVGAPLPEAERGDVDRISASVREALGEDGFLAELRAGGLESRNTVLHRWSHDGGPAQAALAQR
ncbi:BTAD domain-containing putative transcriptional regulator [Thermoactinospora rubra]|uniref:BTAD domain-containing putative transcriptional regulator n=1 Tax=Thermoactinospora rubra TaxID=1088767 RepID=UPI000A11F28F|nr:BTAD domain-containing putative transcriptional regulator [Thermoactinospora rubra]